MLNLVEAVRVNPSYNKLAIGDFLFAEYTCGITVDKLANWSETDYLMHVVSGAKTWHTIDGVCRADRGDTLFIKKGATIVEQHFHEDVCLLLFFIPDALVRTTVREMACSSVIQAYGATRIPCALRVENDVGLSGFFQSMRSYFFAPEQPPEPLVRLKLKELIVSVLTSGKNRGLAAYFCKLGESDAPPVAEIMESNFRYNLSLEQYAKLCHRSLSSFKREFQEHFEIPPGKWLQQKRLDYAATLLRNSKMNVTEIAFESGFADLSHFSRVFKERFEISPVAYREKPVTST